MNADFNYEENYETIVCDENDVNRILEEHRKKVRKEKDEKYFKIECHGTAVLFTLSCILEIACNMIINKYYYYANFEIIPLNKIYLFLFKNGYVVHSIGVFGLFQYFSIYIVRIIPSRKVGIISAYITCFLFIFLEKILYVDKLLYFRDVPIVHWIFILHCISILGYSLFGIFTFYYEDMFEYIADESCKYAFKPSKNKSYFISLFVAGCIISELITKILM